MNQLKLLTVNQRHTLFLLLIGLFQLTGCGGSGGGAGERSGDSTAAGESPPESVDSPNINEPPSIDLIDSASLKADENFDFQIDRTIEIIFTNLPDHSGSLEIYHGVDAEIAGQIFPDPTSRLTSVALSINAEISLRVNEIWQHLIVRWVPMTATHQEVVYRFELQPDQSSYYWEL